MCLGPRASRFGQGAMITGCARAVRCGAEERAREERTSRASAESADLVDCLLSGRIDGEGKAAYKEGTRRARLSYLIVS